MATKPEAPKSPSPDHSPSPLPGTAVAVPPPQGGAVAMPMDWRERMKTVAVKAAEAEKPTSTFISFKAGRLSIGDQLMPGDKIECIVVHSLFHNKWYGSEYDSKRGPVSPSCYAFAKELEDLAPSGKSGNPQGSEDKFCSGCPKNEWASSPKGGRGKACSNSRRIWVIPAGALNDPSKISRMEALQCDLPPTSVGNFSRFVNDVAPMGLPPFAVVCEMSVKPHDTSLFQVYFKVMEKIKDDAALEALSRFNWKMDVTEFPEYPTQEELDERGGDSTGRGANPPSKKY